MTTEAYDVHGVRLLVHGDHPAAATAVDRRLRHFRTPDASGQHDVAIELTAGTDGVATGRAGRPVYDTPFGPVTYDDGSDQLWADCGGRAWLDVRAGAGLARLGAPADGEDAWLISHPLLTIALVELLKRRDLYALHAAALATPAGATGIGDGIGDGIGVVLFPGASGAGKTTLALALLRQGWGFLADDLVFLSGGDVLGFPDEVDVSEETAALFPAVAGSLHAPAAGGRAKRSLLVEEAFGGAAPVPRGRPVAVVLPHVSAEHASRLAPLPPGDALVALAPNVLLTDAVAAQAHFDSLGTLVRSAPCFTLATGRDFGTLGRALASLPLSPRSF